MGHIHKIIFYAIVMLIGSITTASASEKEYSHYKLSFENFSSRTIEVTAELEMDGDIISIHQDSRWFLVSIKNIKTKDGQELAISKYEGNEAFLESPVSGRIKITYDIDISFIEQPMLNANTGSGKAFKDGLFVVAKALFIFAYEDIGAIVSIERPKDVQITVPWIVEDDSWFAKNYYELTQANVIFTPADVAINITNDKIDYSLVALSLDKPSVKLIQKLGEDVANYYVNRFPLTSRARFVQLIFAGSEVAGEAYPSGTAISVLADDIKDVRWRLTVAHELFHLWFPHGLIISDRERMEWFNEGFANYVSELVLFETGYIDENQLADLRLKNHTRAKNAFQSFSGATNLLESGTDKFKFNDIVYAGGGIAAYWLDDKLKQKTGGTWNLIKFLSHTFKKFSSSGVALDPNTLLSEISELDKQIAQDLEVLLKATEWTEIEAIISNQ